jgi:hypothetical protein
MRISLNKYNNQYSHCFIDFIDKNIIKANNYELRMNLNTFNIFEVISY